MSDLDRIIKSAKVYQDIELATAVSELKKNPAQLQAFLQNQQNSVYTDIVTQKDNSFQKVYGDLTRAGKVQESVLMYDKRNKELIDIQEQVYGNQKNSADAVMEDQSMARRKHEMNEWTVGNKNDTLFVFSSLFIMLSGLLLITVLWRMSMLSASLWVGLGAPMILIFVLIVINRSQYTDVLRNKRYWNKQIFEGKYGKVPLPLCPQLGDDISNMASSLQSSIQKGMTDAAQGVAKAAAVTASVAGGMANSMKPNAASTAAPA